MRRVRHETWARIIAFVYATLMVNFLLVVTCLPLVVLLSVTDPRETWLFVALVAPLAAPALVGAFSVFDHLMEGEGASWVPVTFFRGWRTGLRRSLTVGALASALVVVLGVDIRAVWGHDVGALAIPVFVVLIALVLATTMYALVAVAVRPRARLRDLAVAGSFLAVRRWYLTAVSAFALVSLFLLFTRVPAIALGLAAAPLWYVVWANCRFALRPVLGHGGTDATESPPTRPPTPAQPRPTSSAPATA